ncbi:MAG: PAC2 family protein [Candidatus Bathyarchaeota archaeon]|nr:PAC2 family protein [Candidatus Bathyarchaeota archaeon]
MAGGSVEIVETAPFREEKTTVVTGFAGPGFIGSTALMYIVRNRGLRQRAYVRTQLVPPMMLLIDGQPKHALRIYGGEKESPLMVVSEALISGESCWRLGAKLMEWLSEKGASAVVSIEALPYSPPSMERVVFGFSTPRRDLPNFGVQTTREGVVSGMNACLLEECLRRDISWTSLFVGTNIVSGIDHGGTAAAIEVLNKMFGLAVDAAPLKQRGEMIRQMAERRTKAEAGGFLGSLRRRRR